MSTIPGIYINGRPLTAADYAQGALVDALLGRKTPTNGRTPAAGMVNFYALDGSVDLTVLMGDGPATLTGGDGGWNEEARRGLAPATWWSSPTSYRQSVPLMFDGDSQEAAINSLYQLARTPGSRRPPPLVAIAGQAVHRADLTWVVEGIDPGSNVIRRARDGNRVRQDFTVRLLQYTAVETVVERSPSRQAASRGGSKTAPSKGRTTYRVQAGDTLPKIAARKDVYGDAALWKKIAAANNIRDPRALTVGRVLKIPR